MNINQEYPYYKISPQEALEKLNTNQNGLSSEERQKRAETFGKNKLEDAEKTSIWSLIIKQFKDFLVYVLFAAALIAFFAGHITDVYVIIGVIIVNAAIGFSQEYKAEKAVQSLKKLISQSATILENGKKKTIEAEDLVPGDILLLNEGEAIPADARITESKDLRVTEASLTGESVPVKKQTEALDEDSVLSDRENMIYKGTYIARGSAKAVVCAIAENTELGKIAESLKKVGKQESRFKKLTRQIAKIMAIIATSTALVVFLLGYFLRNLPFDEILLVTIATLVSSVPEGLPAVLSIVLAIGANRMAKNNAVIREFTATETAGSLDVILTDKTGTLTNGILTVKKIFIPGDNEYDVSGEGHELKGEIQNGDSELKLSQNKRLTKALLIAKYCNRAEIEERNEDSDNPAKVTGDPTEAALMVLSEKIESELPESIQNLKRIDDLPFHSDQKYRASLLESSDGKRELVFVGAPEKILSNSNKVVAADGNSDLGEDEKSRINDRINKFSDAAMRVIACAYKPVDTDKEKVDKNDISDLIFTGLFGIIDPPRKEAAPAIAKCKTAGIRVIMVTGDHKHTAAAIAKEVGILSEDSGAESVLAEQDLDVDDEQLDKYTDEYNVFARISPNTKLRIAKSMQNKGRLIGMTGDGVNDAPALKAADLGVAMGQRGTDVARDSSQIVLSDDNFSSIVAAVEQGRIVFRNLRRTTYFLLTTNFASTSTLIAALSLGFTYPISATQVLWVNLITDGVMDISLATEPGHKNIMKEPPIGKNEPIITKKILPNLLIMVPVMVTLALLVFNHYRPQGVETARTGAFLVIAATQIFNAFNLRSLKQSVFNLGFFKNRWLIAAFFLSVLLQILALKLPFMQNIFKFTDLPWADIGIIFLLSSVVFLFGELYKFIRMKISNYKS